MSVAWLCAAAPRCPCHNECALLDYRTKFARQLPWIYFAALAGVNLYICQDAFLSGACCRWNTMHGQWMSLARLAGFDWLHPTWWRYWGGGEPLEHTYAPLIPFTIAAISRLFGCSPERALNALTATVYCAGPLTCYVASWRISRRPGCSFAAAMAWSLLSAVELIMPDGGLNPSFWEARRLNLAFQWDDLPHLTSLAFLPIAVWGLWRALEHRRPLHYAIAGFALAGMMLANMFGMVLAAFLIITVPLAAKRSFIRAAAIAVVTYIIVSPWITPSLLLTMRSNESRNGEAPWSVQSFLALAIIAVALWIVWRFFGARWLLLFGSIVILIPLLARLTGWHFVPQPVRYKVEADLAFVWLAVFGLAPVIAKMPTTARIALLTALTLVAGRQMLAFRREERQLLAPADAKGSIQFRTARWVAANLPGERVMLSGSLGNFLDLFTTSEDLGAEPYTTGPNFEQKIAIFTIYTGMNAGGRDADDSLLWLKAFGVHAVAVPGPRSPEYWKPFTHPRKFDGVLPVLWSEDDITLYRIPQPSPSQVHVLRTDQLVHHAPPDGLHVEELRAYVAAVDADSKGGEITWDDANRARIRTAAGPGEIVATGITYHPGWHATVNGVGRPLRADGIGLMVVDPDCTGRCDIRLEFDGGWEWKACAAASGLTLLLLLAATLRRRYELPR